jgi:hypothetical protein
MPEWVYQLLSFVGGVGAAWLLLRIRFERFEAMDTRREEDWKEWRESVDNQLRELSSAALSERVRRIEQEIGTHETGIRGGIHRMAQHVQKIDMRLRGVEKEHGE